MATTIKGPAIFLAQFAGDAAPFNSLPSIAKWAAGLGYKGIQIPTWDGRLFDLKKAASSKTYCDDVKGMCADAGVEIWEYDRTLLHQKVMVVDRLWSSIGTANFDDRSLELNDEVQLGMVDPGLARTLADAWDADLRFAHRIDPAAWQRRGWWHRLKDRLAYTINEQL